MSSEREPQQVVEENGALQPRTILFLGEFSSGKSSLINTLIGQDLFRTRVTATQVPTIELRFGDAKENVALDYSGATVSIGDSDPLSLQYNQHALIRLHRRLPILQKMSLIDTPGISDPLLPMDVLRACADSADLALWCTHATQAWRESESATWRAMPERLREHSLLIVTRSDQLSLGDRKKLAQRLESETKDLFRAVIFVAAPVLSDLLTSNRTAEPSWVEAGGAALFAALDIVPSDVSPDSTSLPDPTPFSLAENDKHKSKWLDVLAEEDATLRRAHITALVEDYAASSASLLQDAPGRSDAIRLLEQRIREDQEQETGHTTLEEGDLKGLSRLVTTVANAVVWRADRKALESQGNMLAAADGTGLAQERPQTSTPPDAALQGQETVIQPDERNAETDAAADLTDNRFDHGPGNGASSDVRQTTLPGVEFMATDISALRDISGFVGACIVDSESGLMIGSEGGGALDLEMAAAGNTDFLRSKQKVMADLGLNERIEDILITLGSQIHLIRPLEKSPTVFLYLALDKASSNLGMARIKLRQIESTLEI